MIKSLKEGNDREAMKILRFHYDRIEMSIKGFYNKVCELYYSDEWAEPTGKAKLNMYLLASAEYLRSLEVSKLTKAVLESVDEDIFGIDW